MMRISQLAPEFVKHIPHVLDPGKLYISMEYATAAHSCCCGCGEEVVTPFTPTDWCMTFDGESVSLSPSVGNWYLACKSHYVVKKGRVLEALPWSDRQIDAEWERDREAKDSFYGVASAPSAPVSSEGSQLISPPTPLPVASGVESFASHPPKGTSNTSHASLLRWLSGWWHKN